MIELVHFRKKKDLWLDECCHDERILSPAHFQNGIGHRIRQSNCNGLFIWSLCRKYGVALHKFALSFAMDHAGICHDLIGGHDICPSNIRKMSKL